MQSKMLLVIVFMTIGATALPGCALQSIDEEDSRTELTAAENPLPTQESEDGLQIDFSRIPQLSPEEIAEANERFDALRIENLAGNRIFIRKLVTAAFLLLDRAAGGRDVAPVGPGTAH
jgi:hypothetical protein